MPTEIAVQVTNNKTITPLSDEDHDKLSDYRPNQILKCKLTGVRKPRSYLQLKLFWVCCKTVADNTEDLNWDDKGKVAFQCKVETQFIDASKTIVDSRGAIHFHYRSISFKNLHHMEACRFFDRSFKLMAKFLKTTVEKLTDNAKNN